MRALVMVACAAAAFYQSLDAFTSVKHNILINILETT